MKKIAKIKLKPIKHRPNVKRCNCECCDKRRAYHRNWRKDNPDKVHAWEKRNREKYRAYMKAYMREYYKNKKSVQYKKQIERTHKYNLNTRFGEDLKLRSIRGSIRRSIESFHEW